MYEEKINLKCKLYQLHKRYKLIKNRNLFFASRQYLEASLTTKHCKE